jgi:hypothetical protein
MRLLILALPLAVAVALWRRQRHHTPFEEPRPVHTPDGESWASEVMAERWRHL